MAICTKCGAKNDEDSKFCASCGSKLGSEEGETGQITEENIDKQSEDTIIQGEETITIAQSVVNNVKKNKLKIAGISAATIALVTCVCIGVGTLVNSYLIRKKPVYWLYYGVNKSVKANTMDSTSTINIKVDSIPNVNDNEKKLISSFVNALSIQTRTKYDKKANESSYDLSLIYNKESLIDTKLYVDKRGVIISAPALYYQNVYLDWDEVNKLNSKANKSKGNIDINKYTPLFDLEKSKNYKQIKNVYLDFLTDKLNGSLTKTGKTEVVVDKGNGDKKTIKCDGLALNIDSNQAIEITRQLMLKAADDPNVKALVKEKLQQFLDTVDKNNDYSKFGFTKEDANKFMKDFDKEYNKFASEIKKSDKINNQDFPVKINAVFKFDSRNRIRGVHEEFNITKGTSLKFTIDTTVNSIDDKITVDRFSRNGAVDLVTGDKKELQDMQKQVSKNLLDIVQKKLFKPLGDK